MPLSPGARLGAYEIVSLIGAGGMGEVYGARDTRLDRTVAIKILPAQFGADPMLRDRFDREARAISSLNHPHICALYDVGEADTIRFLVLEYLEGETLAARLTRGALPPDVALKIAIEICDALDRAHRAGIVHRDLKPANVFLVRSGAASAPPVAKLLDFGLAKSAAPIVANSGQSMLPTTPPNLTAQGTILGTFQYMAPEQIEGLEADARTDIFAFGALLFEMLIGRTAFEGKTRASLLGAILKDEPPRVTALQPVAPPMIDRIVATCLAKDPDDRYQTARDLLRDLKWIASGAHAKLAAPVLTSARPSRAPWLVAAALGVALLASAVVVVRHARERPPTPSAIQFTVAPPDNIQFGGLPGGGTGVATQLAVSPDGRNVVAVAGGLNGYQLWLRPFDGVAWRAIPGSEGSAFPFWSPDSRFVGFFAGGKLKKVQVSGGPPTNVCDAARGLGGTWNRNNVIVFGVTPDSGGSVLLRVSANGGTPAPTSVLDKTTGETSHRWPQFLPDDRHFLYTAAMGTCCPAVKPAAIRVGAIDSPETVTLFQAESSVSYAAGYLLFSRDGTLMAQRFDPANRSVTGDSFPVTDLTVEGSRYASFSVSESGVLAYSSGTSRVTTRLTWLDRAGTVAGTVGAPASYLNLALARDDRHVAVSVAAGASEGRGIWIFDVQRGGMSRLTFDAVDDTSPIWSPDGSRVAFHSVRTGESSLRQTLVSGTAQDELLVAGPQLLPSDWSPDGRFITYSRSASSADVWILPVTGERKPFALAQTPFTERNGAFSPDGRWIAYQSNETGQPQVYVRPFPPTDRKFLVSIDGGEQPTWRGDGKELFFLAPDSRMMAASVDTSRQFEAGTPQALFVAPALGLSNSRQYAVSKDGKRFLMNVRSERATATPLTVVVNWLVTIQK
jgi:Tol biopolymer transport system component